VALSAHPLQYRAGRSLKLQQLTKLFNGKTSIANDTTHCNCIDGVVTGNRENPLPITHHDMFALTHDLEAGLLKRANCVEVVNARYLGQG
jgi:hypothetical protein